MNYCCTPRRKKNTDDKCAALQNCFFRDRSDKNSAIMLNIEIMDSYGVNICIHFGSFFLYTLRTNNPDDRLME